MGKCWVKFTEKKNVKKIVYIEIKMCDVNKPYISRRLDCQQITIRYSLKFMYDSFGYTILSVKEKLEYCRCKT